jgi:hypothetical protein
VGLSILVVYSLFCILIQPEQILPNPPFSKEGTILATPKYKSSSLCKGRLGGILLLT